MAKRIIFENEEGGVSIIVPILESGISLEQIAKKDVPVGVPYKIIEEEDIPQDRTFRNAWEANITNPDGYGADYGYGSKNVVVGWNINGTPVTEWRDE